MEFELGSQESMNVPIWIIIKIQQRDRRNSLDLSNDSFCRLPVTSAQCNIGTEKYPDGSILVYYDEDVYSQGYAEIKEAFRSLTKEDILQPYTSDDDFRSSNKGVLENGYSLYVFDLRYQHKFTAFQPIKREFIINEVVSNDVNGYALLLTNKLVSISSDGQTYFDLI